MMKEEREYGRFLLFTLCERKRKEGTERDREKDEGIGSHHIKRGKGGFDVKDNKEKRKE